MSLPSIIAKFVKVCHQRPLLSASDRLLRPPATRPRLLIEGPGSSLPSGRELEPGIAGGRADAGDGGGCGSRVAPGVQAAGEVSRMQPGVDTGRYAANRR